MLSRPGLGVAVVLVVTAIIAITVSGASAANPPEGAGSPHSYVALGDSFTSGPLIPDATGPLGCGRSDHNYPHLVAASLQPGLFIDVSCGGATTKQMTTAQTVFTGPVPPQFDALSPAIDVVTLGIGGNDIGFGEIATTCSVLGLVPFGAPCRTRFTTGGDDIQRRLDQTAPKLAAVIDGIAARAPNATILVVGYPVIVPDDGMGCWPFVPLAADDVPWLRDVTKRLNAMVQATAESHGARFVDAYSSSIGHDFCKAPDTKWVEGLIPTNAALSIHPNRRGMQNTAAQVLAAL